MKACLDIEVGDQFFDLSGKVTTYFVQADTLVLNFSGKAPKAKFRGVYIQ